MDRDVGAVLQISLTSHRCAELMGFTVRRSYASAVFRSRNSVRPSVFMSVCRSVTRVLCD